MNAGTSLKSIILFSAVAVNPCFAEDAHLHPLEEFSIKYEHTGSMTGKSTQQCRNWCNEMVTSENLVTSIMGISQSENKKTYIVKDKIYSKNLNTGFNSTTKNPMYQGMVDAWEENPDPMAYAKRWLDVLGYQATGNKRTILGEECDDYTSPQLMGATVCITVDGLTLYQKINMGPMNMEQKAKEIKRNDPGDVGEYNVPEGPQNAVPAVTPNMDMEQIQNMLQNLQLPSQ